MDGILHLPNSLKSIGRFAFLGDCNLSGTLIIPEGTESIGEYAFCSCTGFSGDLRLPAGLREYNAAFYACSGLNGTLYVPDDAPWNGIGIAGCRFVAYAISGESDRYTIWDDMLFSADMKTLYACPKWKSGVIRIPECVQRIEDFAFFECDKLSHVQLPTGLRSIGKRVFSLCYGISSLEIPDSVTEIGEYCFDTINYVLFGNGLQEFNAKIIYGRIPLFKCANTSLRIWAEENDFPIRVQHESNIVIELVPPSCTSNGYTLNYCEHCYDRYKTDDVPKLPHNYENGICTTCGKIEVITGECGEFSYWEFNEQTGHLAILGSGIANNTFPWELRPQARSVSIAEGITQLGWNVFSSMSSIEEIVLPDSLETLGYYAFSGCSSLKKLRIGHSLTADGFGADCFGECLQLRDIVISTENRELTYENGLLLNKNRTSLIAALPWIDENVQIPSSVTIIDDGALGACTNLRTFSIPDHVRSIGSDAFPWTIEKVLIGNQVVFTNNPFVNAPLLREIVVAPGSAYTFVDGILFTADMKTLVAYPRALGSCTLVIPNCVKRLGAQSLVYSDIEQLELPEGLTELRTQALCSMNSLKEITIPISLNTFEDSEPMTDTNNIERVYYLGTQEQWEASAPSKWPQLAYAEIIYEYVPCSHPEDMLIIDEAVAPTCTVAGLTEGRYCSVCEAVLVEQEVIDALGHDIAPVEVHPATKDANGSIGEMICNNCNAVLTQQITLTHMLILPAKLVRIETEAFAGTNIQQVTIPDGAIDIDAYAFADCMNLKLVIIPGSVNNIADTAFLGCDNLVILCEQGSAAEEFAVTHGIVYQLQ